MAQVSARSVAVDRASDWGTFGIGYGSRIMDIKA